MWTSERISTGLGRVLALVALGVALLLSWPGVRAVRADEPDMTPVGAADLPLWPADAADTAADAAAEACDDAGAGGAPRADPGAAAARPVPTPPVMRPGQPGVEARPGVVLLNNRGYNYGGSAGPDPAQWLEIEREAGPTAD
jgi:hypothetical protein